MKTLEQFELELVKIKGQVAPDFVGRHSGGYLSRNGDPCIMGQFLINQGVGVCQMPRIDNLAVAMPHLNMCQVQTVLKHWDIARGEETTVFGQKIGELTGSPTARMFEAAVRANDAGRTWHSIVDELVPPVKHPYLMEALEPVVLEETAAKAEVVAPQELAEVTV